jgi:hypothetical protein
MEDAAMKELKVPHADFKNELRRISAWRFLASYLPVGHRSVMSSMR